MKELHHLCGDTGCNLEDLEETMDDRNRWCESENSVLSVRLDDDDDVDEDDDDIFLRKSF